MQRILSLCVITLAPVAPAWGYIDYNPTLGDLVSSSKNILVVQVDKVSKEKGVIIWKKVADLKGQHTGEIRQQILDKDRPFHAQYQRDAQYMLDWTDVPGRTAIFFHNGSQSYTCLGKCWYECFALKDNPGWWKLNNPKPTAAFAFTGSPEKLRDHVTAMVAGKEVVVTALRWDLSIPYAQTAADFRNLFRERGLTPVWRIKASTRLLGYQQVISNQANIVSPQGGDAADVPALVKTLVNPSAAVRADAAQDLGLIGPAAKVALPPLSEALKDKEWPIRIAAAVALVRIDPAKERAAVTALLEDLKSRDVSVRQATVEALGDLGPAAKDSVPALVPLLKDGQLRWRAAETLGWIGAEAAAAVPGLVEAVQTQFCADSAQALVKLGPAAKAAVPELAKMVRSKQYGRTPVEILAAVGPEARAAVPALIEALREKDLYYTSQVGRALALIGTPEGDQAVVPFLVGIVKAKVDVSYWEPAARQLGQMGPRAKAALPELQALVKDPEKGRAAADAIKKIEGK